MTLFQVLSFGERALVHSSCESEVIYTWNKSLTLQCWQDMGGGEWEETDIRTLSDEPHSWEDARKAAVEWDNGGM